MGNEETCCLRARAGAGADHMESFAPSLTEEMERLHPESFGWAMACCRHDAEEAADTLQTAYLKILQAKARFEGRGEFKTWLFGVIRRTASERRRQQWRRNLALLRFAEFRVPESDASDPAIPSDVADFRERAAHFRALLNRLPARQREVLHLVYYQQLSVTQAAVAMGVSTGSARQHFDRAKKRLAQSLTQTSGVPGHETALSQQPATHER